MPKEMTALMTERGYEIWRETRALSIRGVGEGACERTYGVDDEVVGIAWGEGPDNNRADEPVWYRVNQQRRRSRAELYKTYGDPSPPMER